MTKEELRDYIVRTLGDEYINVELSLKQLNDIIQDSLDRFTERHYEATIDAIYKLVMVDGQTSYDLPENIKSIIDIIPEETAICNDLSDLMIPMQRPPFSNFLFQVSNRLNVVDMTVYRMQIENYKSMFSNNSVRFDFNATMNLINILGDVETLYLFVKEIPVDKLEKIYSNRWFKAYCIALGMIQWGRNLLKYGGAPLPGGAELNADGILSEGKEMKTELEEQLEDEFTEPPSMIIG